MVILELMFFIWENISQYRELGLSLGSWDGSVFCSTGRYCAEYKYIIQYNKLTIKAFAHGMGQIRYPQMCESSLKWTKVAERFGHRTINKDVVITLS